VAQDKIAASFWWSIRLLEDKKCWLRWM